MREPAFWWRKPGLRAALLAPVAAAYGAVAARRMARPGRHAGLPVLCVGNFTLGGAGKTPTAHGDRQDAGGGGRAGVLSQPRLWRQRHRAEAGRRAADHRRLTSATRRCCWRARRRRSWRATASPARRWRKAQGASVVVMDDGLQNSSLSKDFTIAVVDGRRGIGNARVFPAGPLRAPLAAQLARTDALLVVGEGERRRRRRRRGASARSAGAAWPAGARGRRGRGA